MVNTGVKVVSHARHVYLSGRERPRAVEETRDKDEVRIHKVAYTAQSGAWISSGPSSSEGWIRSMDAVRKIVFGVICALLIFVVFKLLATGFSGALNITDDPQEPPPAARWHEVRAWRGHGSMSTESFEIPGDEWRIAWNTIAGPRGPATLEIFVYSEYGRFVGVAARVRGQARGSKAFKRGGGFYLEVRAAQPWEIQVRAKY